MAPRAELAASRCRSRSPTAPRSRGWQARGTSRWCARSAPTTSSIYAREDFTKNGKQYDFILDNAGKQSLTDLRRALTPTGMLVPNAGGFDHRWMASGGRLVRATVLFQFGKQTLGRFLVSAKQADLDFLKELIEAGKVTPVIDRSYPLSEARQAIAHVSGARAGGGHASGKVTITIPQAPIAVA